MYAFSAYSFMLLASSLAAASITLLMWRTYKSPGSGGKILFWLHAAIAEWALCAFFGSAATTVPLKLFWAQVGYLGTATVPPLFLLVALTTAYPERPTKHLLVALVLFFPFCIIASAISNPMHNYLWTNITIIESSNLGLFEHGPFFWIFAGYGYLMIGMSIVILFMAVQRLPWCGRRRAIVLLSASITPFAGNLAYIFTSNPIPGFDWTLVGFLVSSAAMGAAVLFGRVFDLVPIARNHAMEKMTDGMLIISASGSIIDINMSLMRDLDLPKRPKTGTHSDQLLALLATNFQDLKEGAIKELSMECDRETLYYDVEINTMFIGMSVSGYSIILRNVTELKMLQLEKDRLIKELQEALSNIRTLHGLLPICYSCKKVRNDKGYWENVEQYITEHVDVEISHGLCPNCYEHELERLKLTEIPTKR